MAKSKTKFGYTVLSESWYSQKDKEMILGSGVAESIAICDLDENKESSYEFMIEWHELNGELCPKLDMFEDSWKALVEIPELFKMLAKYHEKTQALKLSSRNLKSLNL